MRRAADEQPQGLSHRAEISSQIDDVGGEQQHDDGPQQAGEIIAPDIAGDAVPRDAAEAGADLLDGGQQRKPEPAAAAEPATASPAIYGATKTTTDRRTAHAGN